MTTSVLNRFAGLVTLLLVLGVTAAACGKKPAAAVTPPPPPPPTAPARPPAPPPPPPPAAAVPAPTAPTEDEIFARMSAAEIQKNLETVYFNFDESTLLEPAKATLTKNSTYLKRWTSIQVSIEGHCDERGTSEYNLGLGDRRATAVRDYLASLGVASSRMTVVSKGKESPLCTESNESCWQQNRRGFFVVTKK
jgi:peptidoglycan-associated lipoprotein